MLIQSTTGTKLLTQPPGQQYRSDFPRFGLSQFANRFPEQTKQREIKLDGVLKHSLILRDELETLDRVNQISDFHCVTTWSVRGLRWSGYRFSDLYEQIVHPLVKPEAKVRLVVFRSQDGYRSVLPLEDLLAADVLLADRLNGAPLTIAHGAPIRLVAPQHYGYKNPKHLNRIEFLQALENYQPASLKFMEHPRARVALEERGIGFPGWLLRVAYRPLIKSTVKQFSEALSKHNQP